MSKGLEQILQTKRLVYTVSATNKNYWLLKVPNPTGGAVSVSFLHDSFPAEASLQLSDALGNVVKTYHSLPQVLEMNELPAGIYFYHIYQAGAILQNGRIIKI